MTAKIEPENDGKTANSAFKIHSDRVKVTAFTLPLHPPQPGYSRGTAFAAGRTDLNSSRSRNNVEGEHEKRSGHATSDSCTCYSVRRSLLFFRAASPPSWLISRVPRK
ncbi:hypothetical protein EO268_20335 [Salmonella enterica subsp. enterica serovar Schwarzengrund]|nr:hypothetical protein [Salmonella enterica subsp. enterica serovar Eastbourne]EBX9282950.1 hypothetical protein [Salmonella enterica subsp. enterica serovar Gaminara]ECA7285478.1 hypothetical protein [Salmonella enterica subsp. enterica serovar Schwarzengrund]